MKNNVTVVIRSIGEYTESKCNEILSDIFGEDSVFLVKNESPFSKAIEKTFNIGIKENKKYTLVVDADCLVNKNGIEDLLDFADGFLKNEDKDALSFQGLVFDKFSGFYRYAGCHLYQTSKLEKCLEFIEMSYGNNRPETFIKRNMVDAGFSSIQTTIKVGLHDFYQSNLDIIKKASLHMRKHGALSAEMYEYWSLNAKSDKDFMYAMQGKVISDVFGCDISDEDIMKYLNINNIENKVNINLDIPLVENTKKNKILDVVLKADNVFNNTNYIRINGLVKRTEENPKVVIKNNNLNTLKDVSYSVRRYYVDKFYEDAINKIKPGSFIIDLGGKKEGKRGSFNIEKYNLNVEYANITAKDNPDYLCNIEAVPVEDNKYDVAILSEVVEHLENPEKVLEEAYRILKPGGKLLICTPFMYNVHADPYDYARYTATWYENRLSKVGFELEKIEKQGLFFSVMLNSFRQFLKEFMKYKRYNYRINKIILILQYKLTNYLLKKDNSSFVKNSLILNGHTTGFSVVCKKK